MMQRYVRMCPATGWPCLRRLPKDTVDIRIHGRNPTCSLRCAENYASGIHHEVYGVHETHGPEGKTIAYYTQRLEKRGEAKK